MKKVILALVASAFVSFAYAQDVNFDSFKRIESDKVLNLSADQIAKIKKLNKEVGPKFRAIGRSNLPGYEKGQKKRALALEHKAAIRAILSENQIKAWETHYGSMNNGEGLRGIMKDDSIIDSINWKRSLKKIKRLLKIVLYLKMSKKTR